MTNIAVVDYGVGNVKSICSAFDNQGAKPNLTRDPSQILQADGVVLPGVGAFGHGMEQLRKHRLDSILADVIEAGQPLLGICLGMQMLFDSSSEYGQHTGLGFIPGKILRLDERFQKLEKLPHVGWSQITRPDELSWEGTILSGVPEHENMYFVHSYFAEPTNLNHILSTTEFSEQHYCSTVKLGNIYGCQYHPEKSGPTGLRIINNFIKISRSFNV